MPMGRPKVELTLSEAQQSQLASMARSRSILAALVTRATVGKWRVRFLERRINGLYDEVRPGKPRTIDDERVAELIHKTLHTKPADGSTRWSVRAIAAETTISATRVHRYFKLLGLQPHRSESFKLSTDPFFIEKLRDVVGLYLSPPENALVLCVDEKSQIQALDRTQPGLPLKRGRAQTMTHDYKRHGVTTLFAAMNTLDGSVIGQCQTKHRHQEWLNVLRKIDCNTPKDKELHLIADNYAPHKHPEVQAWLAKHPRFHMHFTPTSASWLNMVERFFRDLSVNQLRRAVFRSVPELIGTIEQYVQKHNRHPKPFIWTAKTSDILAKVTRARAKLNKMQSV